MCPLQSFISLHPHSVLKDQHTPATPAIVADTCTGCSTMGKSYKHIDDTERPLVVSMRQAGLKWKTITDITSRPNPTLRYPGEGVFPCEKCNVGRLLVTF